MAASVWVWQERHTSDLIFTSGEPEMPWPWATGAAMLDSILGERERLCPYTQCTVLCHCDASPRNPLVVLCSCNRKRPRQR